MVAVAVQTAVGPPSSLAAAGGQSSLSVMELSPEQKSAVKEWVAGGDSIADVQRRLREEFKVSLTFMDTRFLLDDLNLELVVPEPPKQPESNIGDSVQPTPPSEENEFGGDESFPDETVAGGAVSVEVDRLTRPGTVVSGSVTFSDGKTGKWALDQTGRLIFESAEQGYRPSDSDLQEFQRELSLQLQKKGF